MPRPFPFPINIGNDICRISRIRAILGHKTAVGHGRRFVDRIFTEEEKQQIHLRPYPDLLTVLSKWDEILRQKKALEERTKEVLASRKKQLKGEDNGGAINPSNNDQNIAQYLSQQLTKAENSTNAGLDRYAEFVAGRFAAKEATIKAYQSPKIKLTYRDVAILKQERRADGRLQGPLALVKEGSKSWDDAQIVKISISHDTDYATAVCLACPEYEGKEEPAPPPPPTPSQPPPEPEPLPIFPGENSPRSWKAQKKQIITEVWDTLKQQSVVDMNASDAQAALALVRKQAEAIDKRLREINVPLYPREFMTSDEELDMEARKEVLQAVRHSVARLYPDRYIMAPEPGMPFPPVNSVIFVSNIASQVKERHLLFVFHGLSPFVKAMIAQNPDGSSKKYGFVVMANEADAKRAVRLVNNWPIYGHKINCGISKLNFRMRERFEKEVADENRENPLLDVIVDAKTFATNAKSLLEAAQRELEPDNDNLSDEDRRRNKDERLDNFKDLYDEYMPGNYERKRRSHFQNYNGSRLTDRGNLRDAPAEKLETEESSNPFWTNAADLLQAEEEESAENGDSNDTSSQIPVEEDDFNADSRETIESGKTTNTRYHGESDNRDTK